MALKTLEELIRDASVTANVVLKTKKEVPPTFTAFLEDGSDLVIGWEAILRMGVDFGNERHKSRFANAMRAAFAIVDAVQYLHYSESWAIQLEKIEDRGVLPIDKDPRRYEIISYLAEGKDGSFLSAEQSIVRPFNKDPELFDDLTFEHTEGKGRFTHMLNYQLTPEMREASEPIAAMFRLLSSSSKG